MRTERKQISKPEQRLWLRARHVSCLWTWGWDTARLGKLCPGRRLNKESAEDVRSLLSGALCVSGDESGALGARDQPEEKASES